MRRSTALSSPDLLVAFAYAPTGLGHLRVAEALRQGLPSSVSPLLLGADEQGLSQFHRVTSISSAGRAMMEWAQQGRPQDLLTRGYRWILHTWNATLLRQLHTVLAQRPVRPKRLLVVATHFTLAHRLAALKQTLARKEGVELLLVVQVTDDSPQHIWYVPGASLTVVPSALTQEVLERYGRRAHLTPVRFEVAPYPVSPALAQPLEGTPSPSGLPSRTAQLDPGSDVPVEVCLPVSGAAVGLRFAESLVRRLSEASRRFRFHVVSRAAPYTQAFLERMGRRPEVQVLAHSDDREVVRAYDELYSRTAIALEVTKPSEQTFKALCQPEQRGGAVLLLAEPVWRQERDNLDFLRRHGLLASQEVHERLWRAAREGLSLEQALAEPVLEEAKHWRALELPRGTAHAARLITWALEQGLFAEMNRPRQRQVTERARAELGSDGVERFWEWVATVL